MPAYKDQKRNTWYAKFAYKNWQGEQKWVTKRGFAMKRDALRYERDFLMSQSGSLDMTFEEFVKLYREERGMRLKESTVTMKLSN